MRLLFLLFFLILPISTHAYDLPYVGAEKVIKAAYEDTFVHLARDYNLGYVEMVAANQGMDPWLPGDGTKLVLPTRHLLPDAPREGVVINLAEMRLYAFDADGGVPKTFPLGVGREGLETPTGTTKITRKMEGPIWFPTARMREEDPDLPASVGPGADNPLGTHALYLGWPQYLIHGTNRPFGIGRRVSSGCMRMYPEDIVKLYDLLPVGTQVTVVDQPLKVAWIGDDLFLEINPTKAQANQLEDTGVMDHVALTDDEKAQIKSIAGDQAALIDWDEVAGIVKQRTGYPKKILTRKTGDVMGPVLPKEADMTEDAEAQAVIEDDAKPVLMRASISLND